MTGFDEPAGVPVAPAPTPEFDAPVAEASLESPESSGPLNPFDQLADAMARRQKAINAIVRWVTARDAAEAEIAEISANLPLAQPVVTTGL